MTLAQLAVLLWWQQSMPLYVRPFIRDLGGAERCGIVLHCTALLEALGLCLGWSVKTPIFRVLALHLTPGGY